MLPTFGISLAEIAAHETVRDTPFRYWHWQAAGAGGIGPH